MTQSIVVYDHIKVNDNDIYNYNYQNKRRIFFRLPDIKITSSFLQSHPNVYFVYGDNIIHRGKGGAAILRDEPNAIGFITKKYPNNNPNSFFTIDEYLPIFNKEREKLCNLILTHPNKFFLISKLGSGLANKYCIFENMIEPWLLTLEHDFDNCALLF